jgi:hypothetical protein
MWHGGILYEAHMEGLLACFEAMSHGSGSSSGLARIKFNTNSNSSIRFG